ncbi:MAG: HAMP domain-containing protein [Clostridiales bacterium]|nr:HAMP domain-containing protein [Clostridiales bacterium]
MFQNMFSRLLALFLVVILLMAFVSAAYSVASIRHTMTESRMANLLLQARDIAYLAANSGMRDYGGLFFGQSMDMKYLQRKAKMVYDDYHAYIMIVDSTGRVLDNMAFLTKNSDNALETLDHEDISHLLMDVMKGQELRTKVVNSAGGVIMTVAVPYMKNNRVQGAVLIHTSAQVVEAEYHGLLMQIVVGFSLATLVAMLGTALYTSGIVKPLTVITGAAETMSRGKLNVRAEVTGVNEVRQLAGAFNVMAEKLETVEKGRKEFVSNVSHELRSPITSIHGFVEGMLDGTIPHEDQTQYLQIVFDETNRLKRLISDLLQLSRMDNGVEQLQWSDFDINELLGNVLIARMNDIEQKELNVQLDFEREPCMVHADQDRISQVAVNIIDNALKFVGHNGRLTICTSLLHDNTVAVDISNDGPLIPEEDRLHIFDRFYKVDKAHTAGQGTGLGLSISQQIMQMHGQSISLLPEEHETGFRFTLATSSQNAKSLES